MFKVKFFYKKDCPKCPAAKEVISQISDDFVESYNLDELEGLTEGAYYMVVSTPSTIVVDESGREVKSWRGEIPELAELKKILSI
ncbi:MAG: thioredoxin family protein [Actinobacteria bacterium]|nr:thioredoxin family protein [Actinomycetota bacterium]